MEMAAKFSKRIENTVEKKEKLLITSNFSFSHSVFKRLVSQGRQKVSLCGNGLTLPLLLMTQGFFVDHVDQDQIAQNVQSDLWSTQSTFSF